MNRTSCCLVLLVVLLVGCSGGSKRVVKAPVVPVDPNPVPVMSVEQQAAYDQALSAMAAQQFVQAEKLFRDLLSAQPRLAGAYVNLALIERARGKTDAMKPLLDQALKMNPRNVDALQLQAHLAQAQGHFSQAEQYLLQAASIAPDTPRVHYSLGVLYELYLQEFDRAKRHYQRYAELSDADDTAMVERWIKLLERK